MIRRGAKRIAHQEKKSGQTQAACPKCGAAGSDPCKNMQNHTALKNNHAERV